MKRIALLVGAVALAAQPSFAALRDGSHDFDFEIGTWKTRLRVRLGPRTSRPHLR